MKRATSRAASRVAAPGVRFAGLLLVCAILLLAVAAPAPAQTQAASGSERSLRVASGPDFPPLALVRPDGSADGFSVELFKAVADDMGLKYRIYTGPWSEISDDVIEGKADLLINMAINPARAASHAFTVPHTVAQAAIFLREGTAAPRALEDLRGKSLLVVAGGHVQQWASAQPWAGALVPVATVGEAMALLAAGKHDAVLVARIVGLVALQSAQLDGIEVAGLSLPGAEQKFAFAVSKQDTELLALLNDGLAMVRADGSYNRIYEKWFHPIEPRGIPIQRLVLYGLPILALLLVLGAWSGVAARRELRRRKAAENELQRMRAIIETSTDLIAISRVDGQFVYLNPAARRALGIDPGADVTRHNTGQFYAPEQWTFMKQVARPAAAKNGTWSGEVRLHMADGGELDALLLLIAHRDTRGNLELFTGVSRDVSERKQREKLVSGEKQLLEMIARDEALGVTLAALLRFVETQAPGMLCSVLLLDADGRTLRHGAAPSLPEAYTRAIDGVAIGEHAGSCGAAAWRREPVFVEDIATDPLWADYRELALRHELRACWSTPVFDAQRKVLGTFAMYYRQPARPAAHHVWLIGVATNIAAIAIGRYEADVALREREERFRSLVNLSQDLYWETDTMHRFTRQEFSPGSTLPPTVDSEVGKARWEIPYVAPDEASWQRHRDTLEAHLPFRNFELGRVGPDGGVRYIQVSGEPMYDRNGAFIGYRGLSSNISERKRNEQALALQNERLKIAQRAAKMIVADWDVAADRLEFSDEPQWLRGPLPGDGGKYPLFKDQVHPDDRERFLETRHRALESGQGQTLEFRFVRTDGKVLWLRAHQVIQSEAHGGAMRLISALYDISDRMQAQQDLQALVAELEARVDARTYDLRRALDRANSFDRLKSEFMANVTHELRTPLNSVIGFAELLKDEVPGPLNARQAGFAADILAGGQRLLKLIEGILEMSRLHAAGAARAREPVHIEALLRERLALRRQAADKRGVTLQLDVSPDTGSVALEPQGLVQAFDALLDNAVKFNRAGGAVEVSVRRDSSALNITVADTGIGIARDDLPKLFQPFTQLDAGQARKHEGIGLGLALARRLIELQGGAIEVRSEPGKGSVFTLRLPLQETA